MADAGIFVAWGKPVPGRERMAAGVFRDAAAFWTRLERSGEIQSFELVSLEPHAGRINDFFLLRGDRDQLARLRVSDEFRDLSERANAALWDFRIAGALIGDGAWGKVNRFEEAANQQPVAG